MDVEPVIQLIRKCEESKFWGAVKFNYKDGQLICVELLQTLKPQMATEKESQGQLIIMSLQ